MSKVTSVEVWMKFKSSEIWADIRTVLQERLDQVRDGLEQEKDFDNICRLQGSSDQLRFLLDLPDITINNLKEE